jgi:thiaminase/transcriptional activator TenA
MPFPVPPGSFRAELREAHGGLFEAIAEHPFVRGVGDGSLPKESFAYFLSQDLLYLDEFAKVLAAGAVLADSPDTRQLFLQHAANVRAVEQRLHETLLPALGVDADGVRSQEPKPGTLAYTSHLHHAAKGPLPLLVAAVLPCYWVYAEVGELLLARQPRDPLYRTWVESYASPQFAESVAAQLDLVDRLAPLAGEPLREEMHRAFRRSLRYEWMFWDQAYRLADWPVGP